MRLPPRVALPHQHLLIVRSALRLPISDLLHIRYQVRSSTARINLPTLTHFPAIPYRSDPVSTVVHLHQSQHLYATTPTIRIHRQAVGLNRSLSLLQLAMAAALVQ